MSKRKSISGKKLNELRDNIDYSFEVPLAKNDCMNKRFHTMNSWMSDRIYDAELPEDIQDAMGEINNIFCIRLLEECKGCGLCEWHINGSKQQLEIYKWESCPNHKTEYDEDFECDCDESTHIKRETLIDWTFDKILK